MNRFYALLFYWIIPLYLSFLVFQQISVRQGTIDTYANGETYNAEVLDFDIKQIAAQSNGYVILKFTESNGNEIEQRLSLTVQMAQQILNTPQIPIRYLRGGYPEIVMIPTYELQKSMTLANAGFSGLGLVITFIIGIFITRFALKKAKTGKEELKIERVDVIHPLVRFSAPLCQLLPSSEKNE